MTLIQSNIIAIEFVNRHVTSILFANQWVHMNNILSVMEYDVHGHVNDD